MASCASKVVATTVVVAGLAATAYSTRHIISRQCRALYRSFLTPTAGDSIVREYLRESSEEPSLLDEVEPSDAELGKDDALRRTKCQKRAVEHAYYKLGRLRESAANRLVVDRVIRGYMTDVLLMRPSHVMFYAPVAVELYFVPTKMEVVAYSVRTSTAKAEMLEAVGAPPSI